MLGKRIIPCLDIKDGRTVKGVNFLNLRDAGDPVELARRYAKEGADELVFLDISATAQKRKTLVALVEAVAKAIDIPFTVGGGITSVEDVQLLLQHGADKVSINSAAVKQPDVINQLAHHFGSQCVVVAIDAKYVAGQWKVHLVGGTQPTTLDLFEWAQKWNSAAQEKFIHLHGQRRYQRRLCQCSTRTTFQHPFNTNYRLWWGRRAAAF